MIDVGLPLPEIFSLHPVESLFDPLHSSFQGPFGVHKVFPDPFLHTAHKGLILHDHDDGIEDILGVFPPVAADFLPQVSDLVLGGLQRPAESFNLLRTFVFLDKKPGYSDLKVIEKERFPADNPGGGTDPFEDDRTTLTHSSSPNLFAIRPPRASRASREDVPSASIMTRDPNDAASVRRPMMLFPLTTTPSLYTLTSQGN